MLSVVDKCDWFWEKKYFREAYMINALEKKTKKRTWYKYQVL